MLKEGHASWSTSRQVDPPIFNATVYFFNTKDVRHPMQRLSPSHSRHWMFSITRRGEFGVRRFEVDACMSVAERQPKISTKYGTVGAAAAGCRERDLAK